jgi:lysylphosphatidylglycerol synthetase-like protein (DUF2156 family)
MEQEMSTIDQRVVARNGLGIAGLILGIVGILFGLVPLTFWIAGTLGVTGLILSFAGRGRVKRGEATNTKSVLFGVITSLIALGMACWGAVTLFDAVDQAVTDIDKSITEFDNSME